MAPLRVFIVADDPLARAGLASLLDDPSAATIVGQGVAGAGLLDALAAADPDVIVWDLGQDPAGAFEHLATMDTLGAPVIALVADEADAAGAIAAGARGGLPRDVESGPLLAALQAVAQGMVVVDPALASALLPVAGRHRDRASSALAEDLTPRELEVLQLLADGLSNKQMAQRLGVSEHTVKFHVNAILSKMDAHTRTEAVTRAARLGLIIL